MRTTLDIDDPVLAELRIIQKADGRSLGQIVSTLLAESLKGAATATGKAGNRLRWKSAPLQARVNLSDKEALHRILDEQ